MFWKFHLDTSGIDTLLAKEDVTLKEILDEEDVLQECKTQNTKLLDFLVQENIIRQLLHYIVDPPDESVDDSVRYKYSNLACEVITLDIDSILEEIASKKECLDIIWSFIETPPPLNPLIASFFSKVITVLICRKSEETFSYLKSQDAVNKLIVHIEISAIMELFVKMLTAVETPNLRLEISRWMNKSKLIEKLIELLHSSQTQEVHYNSSQLLGELLRIGRDSISQDVGIEEDPLLLTLEKKDTTEKLFSVMFTEMEGTNSDSALVNGISVIMSLLEIKRPIIEGAEELITEMDIERIAQGIQPTLDVLSGKFQDFQKLLVQPKKTTTMETTFGTLDPPLGKLRITIASLVATAVATNTKLINEALANTEIIKTLLDLFIQYEWNNFLHSQVQRCISAILSSEIIPRCCDNKTSDSEDKLSGDRKVKENQLTQENNSLLQHLFKDCQIVQKCLTMWENNELSEKSRKPRKGFMGHLTRIINDLIKAKGNGPNEDAITSLYNELEEEVRQKWFELVKKVEETNKKNMCIPVNELPNLSVSDDELPAISKQYAGSLQQAFENYQVQLMTNEFIESFGYDENIDDGEHLRNHFSEVGNVDFSINANEMSDNEKLFNKVCDHKIRPYADLDDAGDEKDVWEERQLTFVSAAEPRESFNAISSDSDSSEDEENSGNKENSEDKKQQTGEKETEEEMDVDSEWTANFDSFGMETQQQETDDWPSKFTENTNVSMSTSGEDFANFTDISKFQISDNDSTNPPVAMETEGSKVSGSPYEVTMESVEESTSTEKSETVERNTRGSEYVIIEGNKRPGTADVSKEIQKGLSENVQPINTSIESTHSHVTSITVKSIRVNKKDQPNEPADLGSAEDVTHTPQVHTHGSGTPVRKTTPESVKQLVKTPALESSKSMEKSEEGISNISERKFTENSHQGVSESGSIIVNGPSTIVNELTGNLQT